MNVKKPLKDWLEDLFEETAGLRNDVVVLNQELADLRRELETERRLRLAMRRRF
jgi:hypothetical protein